MKSLIRTNSALEFLKINEGKLLEQETKNNLLLGLPNSIIKNQIDGSEAIFFTLYDSEEPIAQALRTDPGKALILSTMSSDSAQFISQKLKADGFECIGACGPYDIARKFVDGFSTQAELIMHQGVYELNKLNPLKKSSGKLILAKNEHLDIVSEFSYGFVLDCFPGSEKREEAFEAAKRNIQNKNLFLWLNSNDEITSMAAKNRESKNSATISWVYTPLKHRGHGYGTQTVAALTKMILNSGKSTCNLFTDLLNPTSNSIYQKIGYKKIGESAHYNF